MPEPVRVLIVAASLDILGGQAVQAERLIRHLQNEPSLRVAFLPINPRLPGILRKLQSIKYVRTVTTSILYILNLLREVRKYDVIHIFSASYLSFLIAPTPAILVSKLYGKKILLNYHSGEAEDHLQRWPRTTMPVIGLVDKVVVPSDYLVRVFAKFGIDAVAIFNIIDLDRFEFRQRTPLRPVFLSNRNLEPHYGVDCVLRAFAYIQKEIPDAVLTVVGDGSQRNALENLATELHLQPHATFTGRVEHDEINRQYSASDIYLNASKIDNQPLSILEAFACGLPVVTTDAGGIPDIVTDETTGFLVPVGDHKALAVRALKLLEDPTITATMIERARIECTRYTWPVVCPQWLDLYHSVAKK
ncbi:MAG TPA: glycosyltransferase family 4 protein [Pyrinomonadaceae bacterium]|nr:glycosyltransferase family 4 protein [Pyrinomonadaceae bacterium]